MAAVNVVVNGRNYSIACNDGEEDHLRSLAAIVDAKLQDLVRLVGQIGDGRLMLMAALLLADELIGQQEKLAEIDKATVEFKRANEELHQRVAESEGASAAVLEAAANRVDSILNQLK
jgi:cell division protein ZapA